MMTLLVAGLGCDLLFSASAFAQQDETIVAQDILDVTVLNQPDLSGKFSVAADGTFTFPLVGRVVASGLLVTDVEKRLQTLLADGYLKNPRVSLALERAKSSMVYILGEVRQAGGYPLTNNMTLVEVLARAGSMTERAGSVAVITRRPATVPGAMPAVPGPADSAEVIRINLKSLQNGAAAENILLRDGDSIFVPRADTIYVVGAVKSPGNYAMQDQVTVLQALALAGGLTERGSSRRVRVIRQSDASKTQIKVAMTELLRPGDTVVVGEGLF